MDMLGCVPCNASKAWRDAGTQSGARALCQWVLSAPEGKHAALIVRLSRSPGRKPAALVVRPSRSLSGK